MFRIKFFYCQKLYGRNKKGKIIVADFDNLMKFNDIKLLLKN